MIVCVALWLAMPLWNTVSMYALKQEIYQTIKCFVGEPTVCMYRRVDRTSKQLRASIDETRSHVVPETSQEGQPPKSGLLNAGEYRVFVRSPFILAIESNSKFLQVPGRAVGFIQLIPVLMACGEPCRGLDNQGNLPLDELTVILHGNKILEAM